MTVNPKQGLVWMPGCWVDDVPTLPLSAGTAELMRFAERVWQSNCRLQRELLEARTAPLTRRLRHS